MSKTKELLKIYFKQASGFAEVAYMTRKGRVGPILTSIFKVIGKVVIGLSFFFMALAIGIVSNVLGFPEIGLQLGIFIVFLIMLFEGFSLFFNQFIEDKTTELIIPMPIKNSTIIHSKFIYTYLMLLLSNILIMIPLIFAYGIPYGSFFYWLVAIIMIVLLPALALVIVGSLTLLLGKILATKGARGVLSVVGFLLIMIFSFSLSALGPILSSTNSTPTEVLTAAQSFLNYTGIYPLTGAVFFGPFYNFIIFLAVAVLILTLFFKIAAKVYYNRFILAKLESTGKKKKGKITDSSKVSNPFRSLLKWDFTYLFKTPMFFLYTLFSSVLMPVFMVVPFYFITQIKTDDAELASLGDSIGTFVQSENAIWIVVGLAMLACFICFTSAASTSAFSMDGTYFYFKKLLPLKSTWLYWSKTIIAYVFSLITSVVIVGIGVLIGLGVVDLINLFFLSSLYLLALTLLSVYMDSLRPYMKWTTPKMCLNKNINSLFAMLVGGVFMTIIIIVSVILGVMRMNVMIPNTVIYIILYAIGLLILGLVILLVKKTGNSRISRIQS